MPRISINQEYFGHRQILKIIIWRYFLKKFSMSLSRGVQLLFGLAFVLSMVSPVQGANQPNIVYILADDLGHGDLSCFGQKKFKTPNIDALAQKGMVFTQHYSGSTVCAPSRSCLLTGLHTGHTPVRGNLEIYPEGQHPIPANIETLPKLLRKAGYVTGAFGKWGLGFPHSEGDPSDHFDTFYGFNCQRLGHHYYPHHLWDNKEKVVLEKNAGQGKGTYAPALIHDKTLKFIEDNKDKPFFCYVSSIIPHAELAAPESLMKKFRGIYPKGKPFKGLEGGKGYRQGRYESQQEPRVAFAAMIHLLDRQVGEIVAQLEELDLLDNTLVIFTSDNGSHQEGGADPDFFNSAGPFRGHKRDLYEGGIRVPMIAQWPGVVAAGSRTDHISAFWDVLPTVMEMAGQKAPAGIDGLSFLPTLQGNKGQQKQHDYLYWEFHEGGGRLAIRKDNWKAVRLNTLKNPKSPIQLYDIVSDPGERNDLSKSYPEVVKRMDELFKEARTPSDVFTFQQKAYSGK
jgi:arylsulfatase A